MIFALIAPLGPLFNFVHRLCFNGNVTAGITQLSYNCAFVLMMIYRIFSGFRRRRRKIFTEKQPLAIISPLGKQLPVNQQAEMYFAALDKQWN
uniref:Uncharacterized protein n=1 Tax=Panagrolaimus sp. ES5 TaxID=591445 RepID=A0AC34F3B0_9BILA